MKFLFEARGWSDRCDQAAHLFEALAWSLDNLGCTRQNSSKLGSALVCTRFRTKLGLRPTMPLRGNHLLFGIFTTNPAELVFLCPYVFFTPESRGACVLMSLCLFYTRLTQKAYALMSFLPAKGAKACVLMFLCLFLPRAFRVRTGAMTRRGGTILQGGELGRRCRERTGR